jgi:acyl dehydratase
MRIEEIRRSIGREAGVSEWFPVTQELIGQFAAITGDSQWIHVDHERARRESPFGTTVAHGFLTVALLSKLVSQAAPLEIDSKMRINYGINRLRFPAPVRAGSRIRAHVTPSAVREIDGGIEVAWSVVMEVEHQEKPALAAEWLIRAYF